MTLNAKRRRARRRYLEKCRLLAEAKKSASSHERGTLPAGCPNLAADHKTQHPAPGKVPREDTAWRREPPTTPVTRRPPPPPSSEHPRYLLRLRRRKNVRFSKARRTLTFTEGLRKFAYPANLEGRLPLHRSASERDFVMKKFLAALRTPSPLDSPTTTCPNLSFYLQD